MNVPYTCGLTGSAKEVVACREGWVSAGRPGPVGLDPRNYSNGNFIF
jgi:hypothetical protein